MVVVLPGCFGAESPAFEQNETPPPDLTTGAELATALLPLDDPEPEEPKKPSQPPKVDPDEMAFELQQILDENKASGWEQLPPKGKEAFEAALAKVPPTEAPALSAEEDAHIKAKYAEYEAALAADDNLDSDQKAELKEKILGGEQ